jgi:predicted enzyme related to lactoylglutathione lyase
MTGKQLSSRDILIQTEDIEQARAFYEQALGLTVFLREPAIIGLEAGAFRLFLEPGPAYGPVLEFFVDDLPGAKADLIKRGCRVVSEDASVPKCHMRDPYGLTFNIAQRT